MENQETDNKSVNIGPVPTPNISTPTAQDRQSNQIIASNAKNTVGLVGFTSSSTALVFVIFLMLLVKSNMIDGGIFIGIIMYSAFFALLGLILNVIGIKNAKKQSKKTTLYIVGIIFSLSPVIFYASTWLLY